MLARIKSAAPIAFFAVAVAVNVYGYHAMFQAYVEQKEHADWLYGCTEFQRPAVCENQWLAQYAHTEPPWEPPHARKGAR